RGEVGGGAAAEGAEDRGEVDRDAHPLPGTQTAGVVFPPVGAGAALGKEMGVHVDAHAGNLGGRRARATARPRVSSPEPHGSPHRPPAGGSIMALVDRVKNILLQPKTEWPVIEKE